MQCLAQDYEIIWRESGRVKFMWFVLIKSFAGFLFAHLVLLCLQPVSIIWKEIHNHACIHAYIHVYVWSGEREDKGDSASSGCILQRAYIKKEKWFQKFHPLFFLMSNISILGKSNKLSSYVLFLQPLHCISTWFTWLFKDQQKTPPRNVGRGSMFFTKVLQWF